MSAERNITPFWNKFIIHSGETLGSSKEILCLSIPDYPRRSLDMEKSVNVSICSYALQPIRRN